MNELQLEILKLRQQVNTYKAIITSHDQLLQVIYKWRNRFTTEKALYENDYAVIVNKLDSFAHNIKTSLTKPRVITHMHNETSFVMTMKTEPVDELSDSPITHPPTYRNDLIWQTIQGTPETMTSPQQ